MKPPCQNKLSKLLVLILNMTFSVFALAMSELSDDELSDVTGRASLINIDKYDFDGGNGLGVNNFYRVKLNSTVTTSLNIDELNFKDSSGNTQIGIQDFSLSGGVDGQVTSATITNPYVEFAFAGSIDGTDARSREIIGIRVGADSVDGILSFGDGARNGNTNPSASGGENGLEQFRGFISTKAFAGQVFVADELRTAGVQNSDGSPTVIKTCVSLAGCGFALDLDLTVNPATSTASFRTLDRSLSGDQTIVLDFSSTGVTIDSAQTTQLAAGGNIDSNGVITTGYIRADVAATVVGQLTGTTAVTVTGVPLIGTLSLTPTLTVNNLSVSGDQAGSTDPLKLFLAEDLRFLHTVESVSAGGFLSFQNTAVDWRNETSTTGRNTSPTTAGWWMEFLDPLELGDLEVVDFSLPQNVIQGLAGAVGDFIHNQPRVDLLNLPLTSITAGPIFADLVRDQTPSTLGASGFPNVNVLSSNIPVSNNNPIANCWNGLVGC
jgi:hypothetical protein